MQFYMLYVIGLRTDRGNGHCILQ